MAFSATFHISSSSLLFSRKTYRHSLSIPASSLKPLVVKASTTLQESSKTSYKTSNWQWKFRDNSINIYYEEHEKESSDPPKNILMIPTISDVSTVEEWRLVAKDIVQRVGKVNWRATIVDWPGLGYSDRPKMEYDADVMEKFLVDFMNEPNSPISCSGNDLVVFGGGHAATITVRAAKKGLVKPTAIAAIAPTWAGPLPIVFGRDSSMETRSSKTSTDPIYREMLWIELGHFGGSDIMLN